MRKHKNRSITSQEAEEAKLRVTTASQRSESETCDHFDDLDHGWAWFVLFAAFGASINCGGMAYSTGIIHSVLLEKFQRNVAVTAWVGSLHSALVSAGGPLASAIMDRYSCRTAIVCSGFVSALASLGTAFAPNLEVAIFTCGIIGGIGGSLGYSAGLVVVGFNFREKRSLALGIASSGVGVGLFVLAPLMHFSREYYGFTGFYIILAAAALNNITFGMLCYPSKLEKHAKRRRKFDALLRKEDNNLNSACGTCSSYIKVIFNKAILCLEVSMFIYLWGVFIVFLYLPTYTVMKGSTEGQTAMLVALSGIMTVFGRFSIGVLSNMKLIADIWLYSGSIGIVAIATLLFPFYSHNYIGQIVFSALIGLFFGNCYVLTTCINIKYVGVKYMAAAIGFELFFGGFGSVMGPIFAGFLIDSGMTYDQAFYIAGFCILLGSIASAASNCFSEQNTDQPPETLKITVVEEKSS